ncbi:serine/threonine protein phosphatase [Colletotrichum truncatum]|uniref:Serine/threonine protein phosphatase n=1 Tax=Colletotrichum truncatum TaxID=5467 RepID=A0ACC3YU52_COLTU|nr:serine/threonine protein phosphatase [Colletotrichum truncatum]KAF6798663.1 serine/threonine protein phosphatase [Colletotrichum truncatum]
MATKDAFNETSDSTRSTLEASAKRCLDAFQKSLIRASKIHARELSMVEDQMARFSTWATAMGVFADEQASMDYCLRYASDVRNAVRGILESLFYRIIVCSNCLEILGTGRIKQSLDAQVDRLKVSFLHIGTEISHLNKISSTIRRASHVPQIQMSRNFANNDDTVHDTEPLLFTTFERHVSNLFPRISENIRQRLVHAMLLRRKQTLYRRHRQGVTVIQSLKQNSKAHFVVPAVHHTSSLITAKTKQSTEKALTGSAPVSSPSQITRRTALDSLRSRSATLKPSTASSSNTNTLDGYETLIPPSDPELVSKQKYWLLKIQQEVESEGFTDARGAPKKSKSLLEQLQNPGLGEEGGIICPYCLHVLSADVAFNERKWKDHVKNDLDLYVCLFDDCDKPDVVLNHVDEWRKHMDQHGIFWRCYSHHSIGSFSTRDDYMKHIQQSHKANLSDSQLRALANRNCRKKAKLFATCPLCATDEAAVKGHLESHIIEHLRSLALESFPSDPEETSGEVKGDDGSTDVPEPQMTRTAKIKIDAKDSPKRGTGKGNLTSEARESHIESPQVTTPIHFDSGQEYGQQSSSHGGSQHKRPLQESERYAAFKAKMQAFCAECEVHFENDIVLKKHRGQHHTGSFNRINKESDFMPEHAKPSKSSAGSTSLSNLFEDYVRF